MVRVSVIVHVYNAENSLDVCLDSLINQTFDDFEVICVNDGSADSSLEILKRYSKLDKRIKVFSKSNSGIGAARNFGFENCRGKYVTYLDSEDFLSPVALERMYKNISENNADFMLCHLFRICNQTGLTWELPPAKEFHQHITESVFKESDLPPKFLGKVLGTVLGKMYRRDFIKDIKFPEDVSFEDVPFFINCWLKAERISYLFEPLYFYRQHPDIVEEKFIDIFQVNEMVTDIFKALRAYDRYKTDLLVYKMETSLVRTMETSGAVKRKMFNLIQKTYGNIDFSEYDMTILNRKKVYFAYQEILNKSYRDFRQFEIRLGVQNGK